jgi:hypothetical protein
MAKMQRTSGALKFVGQRAPDGKATEYLSGFPTRDLSYAELAHFSKEQIDAMVASNLYVWDEASKASSAAVADIKQEEEMIDGN